jgi:hypothetical protein
VAFAGLKGDGSWRVVVDGVESKPYDNVRPPVFSADSRQVAHLATRDDDFLLVVNGVELKPYEAFVGKPVVTFDGVTTLHALTARGRQMFRVEVEIKP